MKKLLAVLLALLMVLFSVNLATAEEASGVKAGDIITFGRYPQTAEGTDQTPIEWIVLDVQDGKALLISLYGLDAKPYYPELADVTWEDCSLRNWLNSDFLNAAFTPEEQAAIPVTEVDNSADQGFSEWHSISGNNTQDQVFLLSCTEANRYFGVTVEDKNNLKARIQPTDYAVGNGAFASSNYMTESGADSGWWWFRSSGNNQFDAACVEYDGSLISGNVFNDFVCVRPALWIDLESEAFK